MSPPNYRKVERCCANCFTGHKSSLNGGWYCSRYRGHHISPFYVCDDWQPIQPEVSEDE